MPNEIELQPGSPSVAPSPDVPLPHIDSVDPADYVVGVGLPTAEAKALLPLDQPRNIAIAFSGQLYRYFFRRILITDWERLFDGMRTETVRSGREEAESFEIDTALHELVTSTVERVEGYRLNTANWRNALPERHVRMFAIALRDVVPTPMLDGPIALTDYHEISLNALWSCNEKGEGVRYSGLIHRFTPPTLKQQRKFNRAQNTTRVIGDGRNGRTIYPQRQKLMMEYYDQLIFAVEGYACNGAALTGVEAICREMDGCHKVAAIQALLNAGGEPGELPPAVKKVDEEEPAA